MAWPPGCDPFWSDTNAACSDEWGRYALPRTDVSYSVDVYGRPVGAGTTMPSIVTRTTTPAISSTSMPTAGRPIAPGVSNTSLFLLAAGLLAVVVLSKG